MYAIFGHILKIYMFQFYSIQCNHQMYTESIIDDGETIKFSMAEEIE